MYGEETLSYVEITQVPWKLPFDTQSVAAWNGFEEQAVKTKVKKPALKNSAPQAAKSPGALLLPPHPQPPGLFFSSGSTDFCRGGLSNTEAQWPELPATWLFAAAPISWALRSVLLSPKDKLLCKIWKSRARMGCFSDLNTHPAQTLFYFVPQPYSGDSHFSSWKWKVETQEEMKKRQKSAGWWGVGGVEAR